MKRAAEQFRLAMEIAPTGMIMVDRAGMIVLVNHQAEALFGYPSDALLGQPIETLVPHRARSHHGARVAGFFDDPAGRPLGAGRELSGRHQDGREIPIEIGLHQLATEHGAVVLVSIVDIAARKRAERDRQDLVDQLRTLNAELEGRVEARTAELTTTLKEREVLLQEVHHRVKNNLQVISSLINLQVRKLGAGASRDALVECRTRVMAIALIHEQLYQSHDFARVPFCDYARSLAANVFQATGASQAMVVLDLAIDDLALAVDKAIPCGLVLNELISNALKHGFPAGRAGTLRVELQRIGGGRLRLVVEDDGIGLPSGFVLGEASSLGLQLVCTLAEQLGAELTVTSGGGARFQLTFAADA